MLRRELLAAASVSMTAAGDAASAETDPSATAGLTLQRGVHSIGRDTSLSGDLLMMPGAQLDVAPGATLRILGDMIAPGSRIFLGGGKVDLAHSRILAARPEWWGATPDDPSADCEPALSACLAAHPVMHLGLGDYYLRRTWVVDKPNRRIWGVSRTHGARGTRLVQAGGDMAVVRVGLEPRPRSINDFLPGVDIRWLELGRTRASRAPVGDDGEPSAGLSVRHVLDCNFEGLRAYEHAVGYSLQGAVRTYLRDCTAFRSLAEDPRGRDIFVGFDMDGRAPAISTGGNASLYLIDCNARTGGRPALALSAGCRLLGLLSDTFLVRFETTEVDTGILIQGGARSLSPEQARFGHIDLNIESPVLDQCRDCGVSIADLSDQALVDIRWPYVALAAGSRVAVALQRTGGSIGLSGGQLICTSGAASASAPIGIQLADTAGVAIHGVKVRDFPRPLEAERSSGFECVMAVNHHGPPTQGAALRFRGCRTGYVRARVAGSKSAFASAIDLDAACGALTLDVTGVEPDAVGGRAAVTLAGAALRAPGLGSINLTEPRI